MLKGNQEFVLIDDQKLVYETAMALAQQSSATHKNVLIVEGGPGTGKSVIAVNLLVNLGLCSQMVAEKICVGILCNYSSCQKEDWCKKLFF